jgi:NAD(P)H dehydrogenase (quinone)
MSLVVTGATGHLGRLIVEQLLARGVDPQTVVAAGRNPEKLAALTALGVRTAVIDYADPELLAQAFADAETVLLVSSSEVGQRVAQHTNAIAAAKEAGVRRVVYTSAPKADATDLVLAPEHRATEHALRDSGLVSTILRNNWYTENYGQTLEQARATGVLASSAGDGRIASATRADYAAAAAAVLTTDGHDGAVYELGGDEPWTQADLAAAISEVIGRPVTYQRLTSEEHLALLTGAGLDEGTAQFVIALDGNTRDGALAGGSHELSTLIGRATTPLVDGLRALVVG